MLPNVTLDEIAAIVSKTVNMTEAPGWAGRLGVVAILLGILLTAWHANEWLKIAIVGAPPFTIATMPEPDCEEDELIEEGLSLDECRQLTFAVQDISISSPAWFMAFHTAVSIAGTVLSLLCIFVGVALVDYRQWAGSAAVLVFGAFAVLDVVSFTGVVNSGPLIRQMYLWSILVWFFIHLAMTIGGVAGRENERVALRPANT